MSTENMSPKFFLPQLLFKKIIFWAYICSKFQRFNQVQPLAHFKLDYGLRVRARMLKYMMRKTGLGQSNLLIKQESHPRIDGTLQGAAVSDLLWGKTSALGMCSQASLWTDFFSYSSVNTLHFPPRLGSVQCRCLTLVFTLTEARY